MNKTPTWIAMTCAAAMSCSAGAQVWPEAGDAPDGPGTVQMTVGVGPLTSITGNINRPQGDHVDTYCIIVTNPQLFYATTKQFFGGSALSPTGGNVDSRLWLWDANGNMLLGNDDVNTAALGTDTLASFISDPSTFGAFTGGELVNPTAAGVSLTAGSVYYLSISTFANDPDDAGGVDLANLGSDFDALHGVNPAAGAFSAWENGADTDVMAYNIALQGATFCQVPAPGAIALLGLAGLAGAGRRRKG